MDVSEYNLEDLILLGIKSEIMDRDYAQFDARF